MYKDSIYSLHAEYLSRPTATSTSQCVSEIVTSKALRECCHFIYWHIHDMNLAPLVSAQKKPACTQCGVFIGSSLGSEEEWGV